MANTRPAALKKRKKLNTWRSGLEEIIAEQLAKDKRIIWDYETMVFMYVVPESLHKYTPDFILTNKTQQMFIETKGFMDLQERKKFKHLKEQFPKLDLRFVFSNWNNKITKTSKTTYKIWAEKLGFPCANKIIPKQWLEEMSHDA